MKLLSKFKLGKVQIAALVVAALVIFVLIGRGGGSTGGDTGPGDLDNGAVRACDTFAGGQASARSNSARLALADKVTTLAAKSDNDAVRTRAMELGRHADEGNAAWRTAGNALTQACADAGWTAP
ncbi:hypothetical protein KOI35_37700 [Actinoplanes bogorensis]|uniref:Uncharacterized protein n=1 Tax=Paractinoplanes bogorensis TaxID=1610840 RepID=A0ABS5Z0Q2_9ACTN|nr:hypothetical protein [Actinoplanes bogorensis]MBU2669262.1 hypothetical protein [Actinoplanes bogorensis]